jgi:lambda family phage portal protein
MKIFGYTIQKNKPNKPNKRTYEAADKGRRGASFRMARSTGPNMEIAGALSTLRDRSRYMVRNNGWAKRAVEAITRHTIGEGIQPVPISEKLESVKLVKQIWRNWAQTTACDWYGKTTFYGLQELAMRSIVEGGEVLILKHWIDIDIDTNSKPCVVPLKLELIEGDRIDQNRNGINDKGFARLGVQFSQSNELIGYWLFDRHPGDGNCLPGDSLVSRFYEKSNIAFSHEVLRIGQVRGLPIGVSSFMKMNDFSDYEDAQLIKQKVAAAITAFVTGNNTLDVKRENRSPDGLLEYVESGSVEYLNPDENVIFPNPPSVSEYDTYSTRILQGIAAAYGITYEMLTMDYSRVNFTSGRMAKIDVTSNFKSWQYNMIVPQICDPVWEWFMDACIVAGIIPNRMPADWTAPRVQQLDPVKETNAQIMRIKAGLATLGETIRETGREPDEFFNEYLQEMNFLKENGIILDSINTSINNLK